MCTVSAVMPQLQQQFQPYWNQLQSYGSVDPRIAQLAEDVKNVLERLDRIDKALGLRDCKEEEATKAAFIKKLDDLAQEAKKL